MGKFTRDRALGDRFKGALYSKYGLATEGKINWHSQTFLLMNIKVQIWK